MQRLTETAKAAGGLMILCECLLVLASPYCMDKYMQHWVASSPWMVLWWSLFCVPAGYVLSNHARARKEQADFDREHAARMRCIDPRDADHDIIPNKAHCAYCWAGLDRTAKTGGKTFIHILTRDDGGRILKWRPCPRTFA